jgi:hypothetical protein
MSHPNPPFPPPFNYQQAIEEARALLEAEQQASLQPTHMSCNVRAQRREHLGQLLIQIQVRMQQEIGRLRYALHTLPPLPPLQEIRWAQAMLAHSDLAIFHLTTAGLAHDYDLARLAEAATQLHLPPLCVQMEDLRVHTRAYFGELGLRLSDLCERCGITLPPSPDPLQCAQAFHAILCTMARAGED